MSVISSLLNRFQEPGVELVDQVQMVNVNKPNGKVEYEDIPNDDKTVSWVRSDITTIAKLNDNNDLILTRISPVGKIIKMTLTQADLRTIRHKGFI